MVRSAHGITDDEDAAETRTEQLSLIVGSNFVLAFQERVGDVFEGVRLVDHHDHTGAVDADGRRVARLGPHPADLGLGRDAKLFHRVHYFVFQACLFVILYRLHVSESGRFGWIAGQAVGN